MLAQDTDSITVALQPIVVTANRTPTHAFYVSRSLDIIDEQTIQNSSAFCVEEVLQKNANVNIQPRGTFGVQTDVNLRGALFSQHLLLLDGVRLNDSQTSHHNYDLPISVDQIQQIEILKGPGSALYGPDAYGGVINIITRIPQENALRLKLSGGEYGLASASGNCDYSSSVLHSSNNVEHRRSDGYRYDTDFSITSISSNNTLELPFGTYSLFGGYVQKEFGAYNFYGTAPSKEWTETTFFTAATKLAFPSVLLQPNVSYRRHDDKFMFDIRTPEKYVNIHTTQSYNGEIQSVIQVHESYSLIAGLSGSVDDIVSTNLQDHHRSSLGIFAALHGVVQKNILVDAGLREDFHSHYGSQMNPTMNIGYLFSQSAKVFITAGRSFRAPSYTELYYTSPTRTGNAGLKAETGWSFELGTELYADQLTKFSASFFERNQENLIDFVKFTSADPASHAANFTSAVTRGVDAAFRWSASANSDRCSADHNIFQYVLVSYTYLDSRIDAGNIYSSVYSFTHPRHQLTMECSGMLPLMVHWTTGATHKIKLDGTRYTLVDAKLSKLFSFTNVILQGTNLLNQSYEEIADVPLPGRWLWVGVEFNVL
jgi:vitamin B12 transporter